MVRGWVEIAVVGTEPDRLRSWVVSRGGVQGGKTYEKFNPCLLGSWDHGREDCEGVGCVVSSGDARERSMMRGGVKATYPNPCLFTWNFVAKAMTSQKSILLGFLEVEVFREFVLD